MISHSSWRHTGYLRAWRCIWNPQAFLRKRKFYLWTIGLPEWLRGSRRSGNISILQSLCGLSLIRSRWLRSGRMAFESRILCGSFIGVPKWEDLEKIGDQCLLCFWTCRRRLRRTWYGMRRIINRRCLGFTRWSKWNESWGFLGSIS